jgi:membrane protein required for colicin V production
MIGDWNTFDWIIAIIVVISVGAAFRRGLVRAILGLVGLVGGFELASATYIDVADRINMGHGIHSQTTARIVAYLLVAITVALAFELLGRGVQRSLRMVGLGWFDRVLGAVFGFARACLVCIALLIVCANIAPQADLLTRSVLSPYLFAVAHDVSFLVPPYLQQEMINGAYDFRQNTPAWVNRH